MISRLRGEVVTRSPSGVVVDVGGVGYLVNPTASARRVVLELKEKLGAVTESGEATPLAPKPHLVARDALVELGWSIPEAEQALAGTDPDAPPEERVREALK